MGTHRYEEKKIALTYSRYQKQDCENTHPHKPEYTHALRRSSWLGSREPGHAGPGGNAVK